MKHYLFYIPSFAGGGAERIAAMLATQFCNNGNMVSFVVNKNGGPHKSLLTHDVVLHELKPTSNLSSIVLFTSLLKKEKPDYIYCWGGVCNIVGVLGALFSGLTRKIVISYRNLFHSDDQLGTRTTYYLIFILSRFSHCTVCISPDIRTELIDKFKAYSKNLTVIYNPVNIEEIKKKSSKPLPKSLLEYQENKPFILSVGRFVTQKDYPTLIRAFHLIHNEIPHDLLILGQGPLKKSIDILVKELNLENRVLMPGFIENPFPVFRAASLFALSSSFEGFGNVILEALALGTPVVCTNCPGGPKAILENGIYGPLTPVGDAQALAKAISSTLQSPLSTKKLQKRAHMFSIEIIAQQYQAVFDEDT